MNKLLANLLVTATIVSTVPMVAMASPEKVGQPQILWQSVGTLSPAVGQNRKYWRSRNIIRN